TAQISLAETAATEVSALFAVVAPPPAFGLATTLQLVPSKCSINVCVGPTLVVPTAQTLLAARATTDRSELSKAGEGAETTLQAWPLKCRTCTVGCLPIFPTAQTSLLEVPETPKRSAELGEVTTLQLLPSKCSIRPARPTAQTLV